MKDGNFILSMLRKGNEAREKAKQAFGDLSPAQLNWKPGDDSWSVGQCLDHLVVSDCLYFPSLKKIAEGKYEMSFWENWNPLAWLFGKMLETQIVEKPQKKLYAPKIFLPDDKTDTGILERFHKHLDSLLGYIADCSKVDIDKIHITSPVSAIATYSLRRCITILIQHEHRHLNQAIRVKEMKEFPLS